MKSPYLTSALIGLLAALVIIGGILMSKHLNEPAPKPVQPSAEK